MFLSLISECLSIAVGIRSRSICLTVRKVSEVAQLVSKLSDYRTAEDFVTSVRLIVDNFPVRYVCCRVYHFHRLIGFCFRMANGIERLRSSIRHGRTG